MNINLENIKDKFSKKQDKKKPTNSFELVKLEKTKQNRIKNIYYVVIFAIILLTIIINIVNYKNQKQSEMPTINEANLEVNQTSIPEGTFEASVSPHKTVNGEEYVKVKVGDYTTIWNKEKADALIGNNNQITTKIYILSFENKERFFLNIISPQQLDIIRMSFAGEDAFTPEEVDAYKSLAAYYFTYEKTKNLNRNDKESYNIEIEGQLVNDNIIEKIKELLPSNQEAQTEVIPTPQIKTEGISIHDHLFTRN